MKISIPVLSTTFTVSLVSFLLGVHLSKTNTENLQFESYIQGREDGVKLYIGTNVFAGPPVFNGPVAITNCIFITIPPTVNIRGVEIGPNSILSHSTIYAGHSLPWIVPSTSEWQLLKSELKFATTSEETK